MILYIVRHAIALERDSERWADDRGRPLSDKGEARMVRVAQALAGRGLSPEVVLSSPLARAWRTAEILTETADWPAPEECLALEPGESPSGVAEALAGLNVEQAAIVGHEPDLSELLAYFLCGKLASALGRIKKGGVACVEFAAQPEAGKGELCWLSTPKLLLGE